MSCVVIIHWNHKIGLCDVGVHNLYQYYDYTCRAFGADLRVVDSFDQCTLDTEKYSSL